MGSNQAGALRPIRAEGNESAILFLHGFSGSRDDTWDRFPGLLGTLISDRDIYALGYATSFQPDIVGIWAADPDLPILAKMFLRQMEIDPLGGYGKLTVIAHSMGGLIAQRTILDSDSLRDRIEHLMLFGTPSGGLKKASWVSFWKRQFRNMAHDGEFITRLRSDWAQKVGEHPMFEMRVVAGDRDQFVPPSSSLEPFHPDLQYVVPGDHLSIVKPDGPEHMSVRLAVSLVTADVVTPEQPQDALALAAEVPSPEAPRLVTLKAEEQGAALDKNAVVESALALERSGERTESIRMLERHKDLDPDIKGTLAGRYKRMWLENEDRELAQRTLDLYSEALAAASSKNDSGQMYYQAINIAFLHFVAFDDRPKAEEAAHLAKAHALLAADQDKYWNLATQAEAELYLGRPDEALRLYEKAREADVEDWQLASTALQAAQIAIKLGNEELADKLDQLFTPAASQIRLVFVSYAHEDAKWVQELQKFLKPYMRSDESLQLWVDRTDIETGDKWAEKIEEGLKHATIGVALVTSDYLNSDYVVDVELPKLVEAAENNRLILFWLYVSPAPYKTTALKDYQAANDPEHPLEGLEKIEWQAILNRVAEEIAMARLSA